MTRHERHESVGRLKDGRTLEGYFSLKKVGPNKFRPSFHPAKKQPDGSVWISDSANTSKLPPDINVYRDDMLDSASISVADPSKAGLEPAMMKILLGFRYIDMGVSEVSQPAFDIIRDCVWRQIPSRVKFGWLSSLQELRTRWPFEVADWEHTIWGGCPDGKTFKGGVRLYGVICEIMIHEFGLVVPERVASVPLQAPK